ncbi:hypothetical protein GE09DRAFT_785257 [Coniochaeta sp. 2T2.1]|nr:hypothetical protein GE09DRAFT_785257 [Coniochaeta sp. 2T2.1]
MPAVTQQQPDQTTIHSSNKKRRRDDDDATSPHLGTPSYEAYVLNPPSWASHNNNNHLHIPSDHHQVHNLFAHAPHHHQHRPVKSLPSPAAKRLKECSPVSITNQQQQQQLRSPPPEPTNQPQPARQDSSAQQLLARCHICGRKPTRKSDLDSFASCEGCGQRTCFVCLRECGDWRTEEEQRRWNDGYHHQETSFTMGDADDQAEGLRMKKLGVLAGMDEGRQHMEGSTQTAEEARNRAEERDMEDGQQHDTKDGWAAGGHRKRICSRCCLERGPDGDVVCLGCLPFVEG